MAAALLDHHAADRAIVRSAGSTPAGEIHATVVQVMAEIGIDLSTEFPKPLTDDAVAVSDVVVTMGCGDVCPIDPAKRYLNWELPDPAGQPVETVRAIRDQSTPASSSSSPSWVPHPHSEDATPGGTGRTGRTGKGLAAGTGWNISGHGVRPAVPAAERSQMCSQDAGRSRRTGGTP